MQFPKDILSLALLVIVSFGLISCTTPPDSDYARLRAHDSADLAVHTEYMGEQGEIITGQPFIKGNAVKLLRDGNETFPAMLASIRHAKHYIYMESFTFDAKAGQKFADALIQRRKAGVKVDLIYDAFGSSDTPPGVFDNLRQHGITLTEYNPIDPIDIIDGDANNRDHRKILIVDGREVFVGGVNISAVYLLKKSVRRFFKDGDADAYQHLPWRDTHVKIRGPSIDQFIQIFKQTWIDQHGDEKALSSFPTDQHRRGDISVEAIYGAPQSEVFDTHQSLLMAITLAQHTIEITTGYFVPTPSIKEALVNAAMRGVDVKLLLPSTSDSELALEAGHANYADLLEAGVKIYEFQGEVLHAKTAVIDGTWSAVGSSNVDWRSAALNNECNAIILGPRFGGQLDAMFKDDLLKSKQITAEDWSERSIGERLHEFKASLIEYFL